GIYFSHAALLANAPDAPWEAVQGQMVQLPTDFRVMIANYALSGYSATGDSAAPLPYALSLEGYPYFFVRYVSDRNFYEFAGTRLRGPYGYLEYTSEEEQQTLMYAYNPVNGRPFRQGLVARRKPVVVRQILDLASGQRMPLDQQTVSRLVSNDPPLLEAVNKLSAQDPEIFGKLRQAIKVLNETLR
ncbi:MAG: hypothetical protein HC821_05055, partial [Lewinella sp.]|nr:hypothetical protein [Lewinella sp.]